MLIDLNPDLKRQDSYGSHYERAADNIIKRTINPDNAQKTEYGVNWIKKITPATEVNVRASFVEESHSMYQISYLEYLCQAYAMHHTIVIDPEIIWYTMLCEIASAVKEDPESYAGLFTNDPNTKKEIVVVTPDPTYLPLDQIILALKDLVPTNVDMFLPDFSTTTDLSRLARYAAFADAVSPYYNYSTFLCGFPKIEILGTPEDYEKILDKSFYLIQVFKKINKVIPNYLSKFRLTVITVLSLFKNVTKGNKAWLADILTTKSCGSGGEIECGGWWADSMYIKNMVGEKPENFPSHVSRVEYKNIETQRTFTLNCGLFVTDDVDGVDVPKYGWTINELKSDVAPYETEEKELKIEMEVVSLNQGKGIKE